MKLTVREMTPHDVESIVDYFINADDDYLKGMGAFKSKLPARNEWIERIKTELEKPNVQKEYYYIIWLVDNLPIGHSNINTIEFGNTAKMHLHLWQKEKRASGLGLPLVRKSIPYYFENFKLKTLVCEPYAENNAPNKVLEKAGFTFVRTYETTPGRINFKQLVNRYEMDINQYGLANSD